jgi:hypothetical protein
VAVIEFLQVFYTAIFVWLTCLTAIFVFRRNLPFSYRGFAVLVICLSILEITGNVIGFVYSNNHFFFNIIYTIELTLVPFFFRYWLKRRWLKAVIQAYVFLFPLFVLINTIFIQGFFTLQTFSFVIGGSFTLLLAVAYLGELYAHEEALNIFRDAVFWFSLAYLIYFAVSVPYFGMLNYLVTNYFAFAKLYYELIFDPTICLFNIFLIIGLLCLRTKTR